MKNKLIFTAFITCLFLGAYNVSAQNSINSSPQIKDLIEKKRAYNKNYGFGYRIQIYYGNETRAKSLRYKFRTEFPNIYHTLKYDQPYWKVQVGNYKTKLEAEKAIILFKEKFSGIIVIPMRK